jgi:hypothetical protein
MQPALARCLASLRRTLLLYSAIQLPGYIQLSAMASPYTLNYEVSGFVPLIFGYIFQCK